MGERVRTEIDSMGEVRLPAKALYGAQTARARENFPVSDLRFPRSFIRALGLIKKHAVKTNAALGLIPKPMARAIQKAAQEVIDGRWDAEFVVDVFQTGSGTSTNMNANEVIANRASELMGGRRGDKRVHPNDHVNLGQSSNDVFPTAIHLAALEEMTLGLRPALEELRDGLRRKAREFRNVFKIGRTHLQDAVPMRLGQEFTGFAGEVEQVLARTRSVGPQLGEVPLGGTAIGTGLNTHPKFARRTIAGLAAETRLQLREARNHFEAQSSRAACLAASGALKAVAVSLMKIANDIRWLGSGPRAGLGELKLPALQPGSSIMPGKVNPVICEMVLQVGAQVMGHDATITFACASGNFELNTMMPIMAFDLLQSIQLLTNASRVFHQRCIAGLEADVERCRANVESSLALATALVPAIGYDKAAAIAKAAHESGRTIREVARERSGLSAAKLERLLDPARSSGFSR
jgi:fumarate hydratase class II